LFLSIFWDPPREAFVIPYLDLPVYWYSLFFAFGFLAAYFIVSQLILRYTLSYTPSLDNTEVHSIKKQTYSFVDHMAWYIFIGMLVGARLGHVFFYDWDYFSHHLSEILMTRKGGLASHGAAVGILAGLALFWHFNRQKIPLLSWKRVLDFLVIGIAFAGGCIRIGNFFNQEILGTPSDLPWSVIFGHPADVAVTYPCHPAQLYEASFYFLIFGILFVVARKWGNTLKDGFISGLFLTSVFTFRFFIEWLKLPQEGEVCHFMQMGQLLSLPFIALGLYFLFGKTKGWSKQT
jgi:phosphatidylglycerol---prolipoprotein diacylglyceryl transferase